MSREHACIYSLGESSGPSIGGHPSWILPRPFVQGPQDEPITAQLRNGILFAPVDDDDSDPHVSDMFLMSKTPPSVPLGTVCLQCRWVLYVSSAVEHYHLVTAVGLFSLPSIEGISILLAAGGLPLLLTTVLLLLC